MLGREPVEVDFASISELPRGRGGARHRRRRLDRLRALPPDRPRRAGEARPARPRRAGAVRDRAGARPRARFLAAAAVVGDVRDPAKLRQVFDKYRPGVVFHAAAYKHVAMMEANPIEAVRNNTLGTRVVADVAVEYGAKRFVLVSTDKAANPKTVMGQSKALAEWIVETWGHRADVTTRFVAVRFGNVLGSSGSVVPIFRRQIARGGPVTVTHPEMTRFFMTIPEAVQLDRPGRGDRRPRPGVRPRHGRARAHRRPRREDDPALRQGARDARSRSSSSARRRARSSTRSSSATARRSTPSQHPKIDLITRPPVDPDWLEAELALLERLVEDGETLELVGELRRARRGAAARARGAPPSRGRCHSAADAGLRRGRRPRPSRRARRLLRDAGLLDAGERWRGADARLWLLGDLADRGPDGIGAIDLVRRLERESGGAVRCLLGNHEALLALRPPLRRASRRSPATSFHDALAAQRRRRRPTLRGLTPEHVAWIGLARRSAREGDWLSSTPTRPPTSRSEADRGGRPATASVLGAGVASDGRRPARDPLRPDAPR